MIIVFNICWFVLLLHLSWHKPHDSRDHAIKIFILDFQPQNFQSGFRRLSVYGTLDFSVAVGYRLATVG